MTNKKYFSLGKILFGFQSSKEDLCFKKTVTSKICILEEGAINSGRFDKYCVFQVIKTCLYTDAYNL